MKYNGIDQTLVKLVTTAEAEYFRGLPAETYQDCIFPELKYTLNKISKVYGPHLLPRDVWTNVLEAAEAAGYDVDRVNRTITAKGQPYELTDEERKLLSAWADSDYSFLGDYETAEEYALATTGVASHEFDE